MIYSIDDAVRATERHRAHLHKPEPRPLRDTIDLVCGTVPGQMQSGPGAINRHARPELQAILDELRGEGVEPPAAALRALELHDEVVRALRTQDADIVRWLGRQPDLDAVTGAQIASKMRETAIAAQLVGAHGQDSERLGAHLVERAIDALREDAERVLGELRPAFAGALAHFVRAHDAGVTSGTTPADVIDLGDEAVAAWRKLADAATAADRLWRLRNRIAFLVGYSPSVQDVDAGRTAWLERIEQLVGSLDLGLPAPVEPAPAPEPLAPNPTIGEWMAARTVPATTGSATTPRVEGDDFDVNLTTRIAHV